MKIQYTCTCGAKFVSIIEGFDEENRVDGMFERYDKFKERHAPCHKAAIKVMPGHWTEQMQVGHL
jgi:hypothetical protein